MIFLLQNRRGISHLEMFASTKNRMKHQLLVLYVMSCVGSYVYFSRGASCFIWKLLSFRSCFGHTYCHITAEKYSAHLRFPALLELHFHHNVENKTANPILKKKIYIFYKFMCLYFPRIHSTFRPFSQSGSQIL